MNPNASCKYGNRLGVFIISTLSNRAQKIRTSKAEVLQAIRKRWALPASAPERSGQPFDGIAEFRQLLFGKPRQAFRGSHGIQIVQVTGE